MRREIIAPRPGWQQKLEQLGFDFYVLDSKAYWTEQACYAFTADQIDELEASTEELHGLCLKAVEHVVANRLWERMHIPPAWGDYIERVWRRSDPTIVGRFDLAYDGRNPPKLLEYNADTPTALYEAAVVQWYWLKDAKPGADQFNSIHEKLIEAWRGILARLPPEALVHFARFEDHPEDLATSEYLRDTALQAGLAGKPISVPRRAAASATARRAGRPTVDGRATRPIVITAAADLPGVSTGAVIDIAQVAKSMHEKARALSNGSARVPIARFDVPVEHDITKGMSNEAIADLLDSITAPQSLVAAGGWCVPSENLYDLFALDGQSGLLDLPTVGVSRGGLNVPSYIGIDAADGALWDWSEDQDEATALTISDVDVSSGVATISFSASHLLEVGDLIDVNVGTSLDGPRTVASVTDADTVTVTATGVPDSSNGTGFATRQKGKFRIPCPTWTDHRLHGYGLTLEHGNLTDQSFPELTRRYVQLAMNAHAHRMSAVNIAKITASGNSDAVTVTAAGTDSYGEVMSAIELSAVDYRSEHKMSSNVILEVLLPVWIRENLRTTLAMRAGVDARAVTDAQIDAELAVRKVRPQFLEDYQPMWSGSRKTAWPASAVFTMYPAGNFVEGKGKTIDLGVVRDSRLNATNDFTAAWTEEFSLLARRGPKARKVTFTLSTDGVTG